MDELLLEMRGITKYIYDSSGRPIRGSDVKILDSVSFDLRQGEVHVLVGENGAGKSTLMKILGGIIPPDQGSILLEGVPVDFAGPREARGKGIAFIHQELNLCANLDVAHNIFLGREPTRSGILHARELYGQARALLSSLGFSIDPTVRLGKLTTAHQQIVDLIVDPVDLAAQSVQGASGGSHGSNCRERGLDSSSPEPCEIKENIDIPAPCSLPIHALHDNS